MRRTRCASRRASRAVGPTKGAGSISHEFAGEMSDSCRQNGRWSADDDGSGVDGGVSAGASGLMLMVL